MTEAASIQRSLANISNLFLESSKFKQGPDSGRVDLAGFENGKIALVTYFSAQEKPRIQT